MIQDHFFSSSKVSILRCRQWVDGVEEVSGGRLDGPVGVQAVVEVCRVLQVAALVRQGVGQAPEELVLEWARYSDVDGRWGKALDGEHFGRVEVVHKEGNA